MQAGQRGEKIEAKGGTKEPIAEQKCVTDKPGRLLLSYVCENSSEQFSPLLLHTYAVNTIRHSCKKNCK